jgi:hypothetical protein
LAALGASSSRSINARSWRVSQRVEPRRILLVAMPVAAGLVAALPLATGLPALIGLWAATAFAAGAATPCVFAWLGRLGVQGGGLQVQSPTVICAGWSPTSNLEPPCHPSRH